MSDDNVKKGFQVSGTLSLMGCLALMPTVGGGLACFATLTAAGTLAGVNKGIAMEETEIAEALELTQLEGYTEHTLYAEGICASGFYTAGQRHTRTSTAYSILGPGDCADICSSEPACTHFSYNDHLHECRRFSGECTELMPTHTRAFKTWKKNAGNGALASYMAVAPGCVNGNNIRLYSDKTTEECAQLCNDYGRDCKGFEFGVYYGGRSTSYDTNDCQLSSGASTRGCDGAHYNLVFYTKG